MSLFSVNVLRDKKSSQTLETADEMTIDDGDNVAKKNEESLGELGFLILKHNVSRPLLL